MHHDPLSLEPQVVLRSGEMGNSRKGNYSPLSEVIGTEPFSEDHAICVDFFRALVFGKWASFGAIWPFFSARSNSFKTLRGAQDLIPPILYGAAKSSSRSTRHQRRD
jgi:hypothetical protein